MSDQVKGSASRIVIDTEESYGVAKETAAGVIIPFISETIQFNQALVPSQVISGNRNPKKASLGDMDVSGDLTVPVNSVAFGYLLKLTFTSFASAGTTNYTHTCKIDDVDGQPSFILEKKIPLSTARYEKYVGCKIASWKLGVTPGGEAVAVFSILGKTMTASGTAYMANPTAVSGTPFMNSQAVIKEGGSEVGIIKSLEFTLNNDLDGDQRCIGGGGARGSLPEGLPQITGTMEALLTDSTLVDKFDGSTESSLEVEFTIDANTKLNIKMAELVYDKKGVEPISGPKGMLVKPSFTAHWENDAGNSAITVVLSNQTASYWPAA
jgi:hypothetical protein